MVTKFFFGVIAAILRPILRLALRLALFAAVIVGCFLYAVSGDVAEAQDPADTQPGFLAFMEQVVEQAKETLSAK